MSAILESGRPTSLRAGDRIIFSPRTQEVSLTRGISCSLLSWGDGASAAVFPFLKSEEDFKLFAGAMAAGAGLSVDEDPSSTAERVVYKCIKVSQ